MRHSAFWAFALLAIGLQSAHAELLTVSSYDTYNGDKGSYTYIDDNYTGSGNSMLEGDWLFGGLGKLTDGVVASGSWITTEQVSNTDTNGQYLGWYTHQLVAITFHFNQLISLQRFSVYADDGEYQGVIRYGGVAAPSSVQINDGQSFALGDIVNEGPNTYTFDTTPLVTDQITLTFTPNEKYWVFLSEITFEGELLGFDAGHNTEAPTDVPTAPLFGFALCGLLFSRRKPQA